MASAANVPSQARPWNPNFNHLDRERWICIYPIYLNKKKTLKEGRKIAKSKAVENPVCSEIRDVCASAGFHVGVENKVHPREREPRDIRNRGRVRVQLKNEDNTPVNKEFPDRMSIMLYIAETIPKLKTRQQGQSSSQQGQAQGQGQTSSKGQKKKGRK